MKEELDMSDIPKLEPITDELLPVGGLTEFQEQILDAAIEWQESLTDKAWMKFRNLLVKAYDKEE